jgi:hypothetical protein
VKYVALALAVTGATVWVLFIFGLAVSGWRTVRWWWR